MTPRFPRKPNADTVLDDFLDRASRRYDGARRKHAKDVVNGLKDWLDQAIPLCLLYDQVLEMLEGPPQHFVLSCVCVPFFSKKKSQERPVFDTAIQDLHGTLESRNSVDGDSDEESRGPKGMLILNVYTSART